MEKKHKNPPVNFLPNGADCACYRFLFGKYCKSYWDLFGYCVPGIMLSVKMLIFFRKAVVISNLL